MPQQCSQCILCPEGAELLPSCHSNTHSKDCQWAGGCPHKDNSVIADKLAGCLVQGSQGTPLSGSAVM